MEAALHFLHMGPIAGKTVAIQGAGLVGEFSEPFHPGFSETQPTFCNSKQASYVVPRRIISLRRFFSAHKILFKLIDNLKVNNQF